MRKIFSTVLVATALLFSMQANAATSVGSEDALRSALANGGEIVLTTNIQLNAPLQIAESYANPGKVITLNLNGKTLSNNPLKKISIIELFKGDLTIKNGIIKCEYPAWQDSCKDAIIVHGVYQDNANWSNLTIAKDARVEAKKNAITVMEFWGAGITKYGYVDDPYKNKICENFNAATGAWVAPYSEDWLAYHFKANVETPDKTKAYNKTSATNGYDYRWRYQTSAKGVTPVTYSSDPQALAFGKGAGADLPTAVTWTSSVPYYSDFMETSASTSTAAAYRQCAKYVGAYAKANGVNITVDGYVYGAKYGIKVNGTLRYADTNLPYILVSESAEVACAPSAQEGLNDKESTAIYCSGKAKWDIKGNVHGNIGVTVKGGDVVIDGATITATGEGYQSVTAGGSGINGGAGCGILVSSQAGYTGGQNITIKGDTKITANDGFAINETIPDGDKDNENKVTNIKIEGGTIVGGEQGAMIFTDEGAGVTTVYGANVEGSTKIGNDPEEKLDSLKADGTFVVEMEVGGSTVLIVTKGTQPSDTVSINATLPDSANIVVKGEGVKITENKVFGYVEMPNETSDTIVSGVTVRIGKLVMGDEAQFVIMPGANLIVYGEQGVVAGKESNLVIKADATGMGTFLFNPAVTSNRTPKATVEYYSLTYELDADNFKWDIFVSPFSSITNLYNDHAGQGKMFAYKYWDGQHWKDYANKTELINNAKAFQPIALGNNTTKDDPTIYTFEGELQGNISGEFNLGKGYNFMGNGYVAPMDAQKIISEAVKSGNVESAIWMWDFKTMNYVSYNLDKISKMPNMGALNFFILKATSDVKVNLNYEKLVWEFNNK